MQIELNLICFGNSRLKEATCYTCVKLARRPFRGCPRCKAKVDTSTLQFISWIHLTGKNSYYLLTVTVFFITL